VQVGIQLPVQSQSTYYVEPWEPTAGHEELAAVARAADDAGFDYVAVCDHIRIPADRAESMSTTWYDTVATLGWLAGITTTTKLLSHVFVPAYRHPLATAKAFATLDELSGGRVILGVGAGHVEAEFDALGIPFAERGRLTDEAIDGIRAAWAATDPVQKPQPRQQPGPPIWVGGSSPAALRRAAERGDGWLPQGTLKHDMPDAIARIKQRRAAAGNDAPFTFGALVRPMYVGDPQWETGKATLTGKPERLRQELEDYVAMGVDQVQVRLRSRTHTELVDQLALFGEEVKP
jgi:probable F420-dependent oxidoreductase